MTTFLLDTDIGTDVDDALALSWLLSIKKHKLLGVIVTNGPTKIRARIAKTILLHKGASNIPVFRGESRSKTHGCVPFVSGKEGRGIESQSHAFPLRTILPILMTQPDRSVVYMLIAPATSCSTLLDIPEVRKKIKSIVCMGGVLNGDPTMPTGEHNIAADPISFERICAVHIPIYIVPLNMTLQHQLSTAAMAQIGTCNNPLATHMSAWIHEWRSCTNSFGIADHWFRNKILLHDPLTCLAAIHRSVFRWKRVKISVSPSGLLHIGKGESLNIAVSIKQHTVKTLMQQIVSSIVTHKNML